MSNSSKMVRVVNELIPSLGELNRLCREGKADEVIKGMQLLIAAVERGESFGDRAISARIERLEQAIAASTPAAPPKKKTVICSGDAIAQRFNLRRDWRAHAKTIGMSPERWLRESTGAVCLGNDQYMV